jgi:hypothetical protein
MATASVASDVKSKAAKIEDTFKKVQTIAGTTNHPNQTYLEGLKQEEAKLKEKVLAAWKTLYDQQQEKNPWPDVLGDQFLAMIRDLKPSDEIPYNFRGRYQNFIQEYLPKLKKEVDWRHPKEGAEAVAAAAGGEKQIEMEGIVDWDAGDIKKLEAKFEWKETPSDLRIKLAQEDLWVMLSLLRIIKNTNENVTEHSKAAIKHIDALDIGANAVVAWKAAEGQVFSGGGTASAAAAGGAPATAGAPSTSGTPVATGGGAAATSSEAAEAEKLALLANRYVDDKGNPLSGDAKSPYSEFKMMPICMRLYIDQRKLAKLLVECANSAMPIEVRRVRIHPGKGLIVDLGGGSATAAGGGGGGMAMGGGAPPGYGPPGGAPGFGPPPGYGPPGGMPGYGGMRGGAPPGYGPGGRGGMGGGMGGMPMGGGGTTVGGGLAGATAWEKGAMDIPVEIQGIICIYNPPDKDKLATGAAGETTPADATATPTAPSSAPTTAVPATTDGPASAAAPTAVPEATPAATPATTPAATPAAVPATTPAATPAAAPTTAPPVEPAKSG